jgi:hypothetical protein
MPLPKSDAFNIGFVKKKFNKFFYKNRPLPKSKAFDIMYSSNQAVV